MRIIVLISGGKDSTATLLKALDYQNKHSNIDVIPVFCDTKWESELTYQYLEYLENKLKIDIIKISNDKYPNGLPDLIRKFKRFPFIKSRFCTNELKTKPLKQFLKDINATSKDTEIWLGVRLDENIYRRIRYGRHLTDKQCKLYEVFRNFPKCFWDIGIKMPILDWTANKVFDYISNHGIKPNPLYNHFDRVGCFPCLLSGKTYFKKCMLYPDGVKHLKILLELEDEIGKKVSPYFSVKKIIESHIYQKNIDEYI